MTGPGSDYVSPCGCCSFIMQIFFAVLSVVYDKAPPSLEKNIHFSTNYIFVASASVQASFVSPDPGFNV